MPQLQNIVLTDRAATPVNHTLVPRDIVANVGTVVESTGVPIGDTRFTVSLVRTSAGNFKGRVQLAKPIVENSVVNGVTIPTVTRTAYADCTFTFAQNSTEQERKDLVGMFQSAFDASKVLTNDTLVKLQGVY